MKTINYTLLLVLVFLLFHSCKIGHSYKTPELSGMPETFDTIGLETGKVSDIGWSSLYKDTILQSLIDKALMHNRDVLMATARIKQMMAENRIRFAGMLPEAGMEVAGQREYLNHGGDAKKFSSELRANANVSWELDIWGSLRWRNDAAVAAYMQSVEARQALRLTIVAQVAQAYFELKILDRELSIVNNTLAARKEGLWFAKLRYEGGLTSEIPYRQSLVELSRAETLIPDLENKIKLKENDLSVLVGEFPSKLIPRGDDLQSLKMAESLPVDIPSELLRDRPDVRLAEQRLIEKNAQAGAALADIFPKLRLTGRYGLENEELSHFLESPTWFISGLLTGPVFNFGKNKAAHTKAKATYEEEVYNYEKKVLDVFREVDNAISSFRKTKEMRMSQDKRYSSAQSYHKLAQLQYVNGVVNYLDVLDAQRQLFDAEIALNQALLKELIAMVDFYKVLGGGVVR